MPTIDWLRNEFHYGYSSGNILSFIPDRRRRREERVIGASYRKVFRKVVYPHLKPNSIVLELGPGAGSWSKAILRYIPQGKLFTVDFQDVSKWLYSDEFNGRLECHQVEDLSFLCIQDDSVEFFWSFGVLCHNNIESIEEILKNACMKTKPGGISCHQYGDWDKLDVYGWQRGGIPIDFKKKSCDEIWWPRNSKRVMQKVAERAD